MDCGTPGFPVLLSPGVCSHSCPLSQWCHPTTSPSTTLFSFCLQSFPASDLFQWVGSLHNKAKVLELQLQHQSFQWKVNSGLISFRIDWFDLLAVQGTLKSLLCSVQSLSHVQLFPTPWTAAHQASLSITNSQNLPKLMSIELVMPSNHFIVCHSPSPPALNLSQHQGLFQWVSSSHQVAKGCGQRSFSFSISPYNEHPGLISFRMDWLDLLVVQGTLKSLLQYHTSKASILWRSAFFIVHLSHPYMTTGKTIVLKSSPASQFKNFLPIPTLYICNKA